MNEERIREQMADLRAELDVIEGEKRQQRNAELLGKCFAYRNSYSCPQDESDYWTHYTKITDISDSGRLSGISFQRDKDGKIEFEPRNWISESTLQREISTQEFDATFVRFVNLARELLGDLVPEERND